MRQYAIVWIRTVQYDGYDSSSSQEQSADFEAETDEDADKVAEKRWIEILEKYPRSIYNSRRYKLIEIKKKYDPFEE